MADDLNKDNIRQSRQEQDDFQESVRDTVKEARQLHNELLEQVNTLKSIRKENLNIYTLKDKLKDIEKERTEYADKEKSLVEQLTKTQSKVVDKINEGFEARRKQEEPLRLISQLQEKLNDGIESGLLSLEGQESLKNKILTQQETLLRYQEKEQSLQNILTGEYEKEGIILDEKEKNLVKQLLLAKKYNEEVEQQEKNGTDQVAILEAQIAELEAKLSKYEKAGQLIEHNNNKLREGVEKFKKSDLGGFVIKQFAAIGASFDALLKNFLKFDAILTDSAKELGTSQQAMRGLADQMNDAAFSAGEFNEYAEGTTLLIKSQLQAQSDLNKELGTSVLLTQEELINQSFITNQLGLQSKEAANIYKLSTLNNQTQTDTVKQVYEQVIGARETLGVQLNHKKVLQDVANVSGQLAAQYENNPELIAKAVVQVQALGLEFSQAAKAADSLLNFEQSIQNELKAELLTGRALNLERARELALRGETADAAAELVSQVGTLSEFQNLNVLQQRALADSIGLSADELADSLKQQEFLEGSAFRSQEAFKEAALQAAKQGKSEEFIASLRQASNADQLIAQASQISNQEKFQVAIERLQETLSTIVSGPFGTLLDGFANLVSNATVLKGILTVVGTIMTVSIANGIRKSIMGLGAMVAELGVAAGLATTTNSMLTFGAGIAIALAAAAGTYAMVNSLTGESVSPSATGGGTGVNTPTPNQSNMNQNREPVKVIIDNRFNIAGQDIGKVSTQQQINGSKVMDSTS